jgi:hypothetical protein
VSGINKYNDQRVLRQVGGVSTLRAVGVKSCLSPQCLLGLSSLDCAVDDHTYCCCGAHEEHYAKSFTHVG